MIKTQAVRMYSILSSNNPRFQRKRESIKILWLENHRVKQSRQLSRTEAAWLLYLLRGCNDVHQKSIRIKKY